MIALDLVPSPRGRGVPCVAPCAWCGAEGDQPAGSGAVLAGKVQIRPGEALSRLGAWVVLPADTMALRVVLSGSAIDQGLVVPTAVRLRPASSPRDDAPAWQGSALAGTRGPEGRVLVATLHLGARRSGPLAPVGILEVAGITRHEGEGLLALRTVLQPGGCLVFTVAVTVGCDLPRPSFLGSYVALEDHPSRVAWALARWVDLAWSGLRRATTVPSRLRLQALRRPRGGWSALAPVGPHGVSGTIWRQVLQGAARGQVAQVVLLDPLDPERLGLEAGLGPGGRRCLGELSAWLLRDGIAPAREDAWRSTMARAARTLDGSVLQALVGTWDEPLHPRVVSAWEVARGVHELPSEGAWLGRWLRAPASWARCRGEERRGDATSIWWPGRRDWEECWTRHVGEGPLPTDTPARRS